MYEDYKIYGPYERRDGRLILSLKRGDIKKTISYPKYLMELHLGRKLLPTEDVHHIDHNFKNNNLTNLAVIDHALHTKEHSTKYIESITVICGFCGTSFTLTPKQQRTRFQNRNRQTDKAFCSRSCTGKYGKAVQMKQQK